MTPWPLTAETEIEGAVSPVPDKTIESGEVGALLLTTIDAVCSTFAIGGVKVALIEQLDPAARLAGQLFEVENEVGLAPVSVMLLIERGTSPVFESETELVELCVPVSWSSNSMLPDEKVTVGADPAVPSKEIGWGEFPALLVTVFVADCTPEETGVKVTVTVQLALGARLLPQLCVVWNELAPVPVTAYPPMAIGELPVLVMVTT